MMSTPQQAEQLTLSNEEALRLHSELRNGIYNTGTSLLPVLAFLGRIWQTLGHDSFEDYLESEFVSLDLKPRAEVEQAAVAFYSSYGMSTEAISMITGLEVSKVAALAGLRAKSVKAGEANVGNA